MKKIWLSFAIMLVTVGVGFAQSFDPQNPAKLVSVSKSDGKTYYDIRINFKDKITDDAQIGELRNVANWTVTNSETKAAYKIIKVEMAASGKNCKLVGNWQAFDQLNVAYKNGDALSVAPIAEGMTTNWGFGKAKAINIGINYTTGQKDLVAFDYNAKLAIAERYYQNTHSDFGLESFGVNIASTGTIGGDDTLRNGTQSRLDLAAVPVVFAGKKDEKLIYRQEISIGYQLETKMNDAENKKFEVINQNFTAGLRLQVPWTREPMYHLHKKTGYVRQAAPLTLDINYQAEGEDGDGNETPERIDFGAWYELAFSPFLIFQGEYAYSDILDASAGAEDTHVYTSYAIAQDFDAIKQKFPLLLTIFGNSAEIKGKNFVFFRVTNGRKAPNFQDTTEKIIGFSTSF